MRSGSVKGTSNPNGSSVQLSVSHGTYTRQRMRSTVDGVFGPVTQWCSTVIVTICASTSQTTANVLSMFTVVVMHSVGLHPMYKSADSKGSMGVSAASFTHSPRTTVVAVSTSTYFRVTYYDAILPMPGKPKVGPMPPSAVKFAMSVAQAPISGDLGKHNFSLWFFVTHFANRL